ncbi:hypothetical protein [Pseudomarimonas arenosa]|uniref:Uncharacterized protein n=1 Tax=Pseudomarimonas arenosa TaxID=2774145 RepID=A0AAW3ZMD4_9GAMM|nr:hypothetical protein [Pseudomarimonas arenosa]MBD8526640.1 hypothetical protein [Pseudomarimonas arenosa]
MRRFLSLAAASVFSLALIGCQSEQATTDITAKSMGPGETVAASAKAMSKGDLVSVLKAAVPPAQYEKMKTEWVKKVKEEPASDKEKAEFAEMMAKLTAADAETALYTELEPQLAKMEQEMAAQMPLMIGMGRGFAAQAINESEKLTADQKAQASAMLDATAKWLEGAKFFDRDKAKQAIAAAVKAARGLEIQTLDQVEAMEFEQMLGKAGQAYVGLQDVLAVYGFDLAQTLNSVKADVVNEQADSAKVKVAYTLFGEALSFETDMIKRDDRWYGKEALAEIEKELNKPAAVAGPVDETTEEVVEEEPATAN